MDSIRPSYGQGRVLEGCSIVGRKQDFETQQNSSAIKFGEE
jgi:hypothetical protein